MKNIGMNYRPYNLQNIDQGKLEKARKETGRIGGSLPSFSQIRVDVAPNSVDTVTDHFRI